MTEAFRFLRAKPQVRAMRAGFLCGSRFSRRPLKHRRFLCLTGRRQKAAWNQQFWFAARAATVALGVMGLLAAMLAVTGIFGMAAYNVSRRMKELGIRVALGAKKMQILQAGVGRPFVLLMAGSAVGLLIGTFASRFLGRIVYEANPRDPLVLCGAIATMVFLGITASLVPALRALRVDPSRLMREE